MVIIGSLSMVGDRGGCGGVVGRALGGRWRVIYYLSLYFGDV